MIQFYKPNAKNTGSACSFSYNKKEKALWVNFIRQASWNPETKNGTFATIKPGWSTDFKVNGKKHTLELWSFNTPWEQQSMFFKLFKVKDEERLEDQM